MSLIDKSKFAQSEVFQTRRRSSSIGKKE